MNFPLGKQFFLDLTRITFLQPGRDMASKTFQNEAETMKKMCLKMSISSRFGLNFGRVWDFKSAALLAAPGVLDPTAFYACINMLH